MNRFPAAWVLCGAMLIPTMVDAQLGGAPAGPGDSNPIQLLTQGVLLYRKGEPREAAAKFRALVKGDPQHSTAHYYLGLCHASTGDVAAAVQSFGESVATGHPDPATLLTDRAVKPLLEKNSELRKGVEAIVARDGRRRKGELEPVILALAGKSRAGVDIRLADLQGAPVAVIFLDATDPLCVEAAYRLQAICEDDDQLRVLGVVECPGKGEYKQMQALDVFVTDHGFNFPVILSTPELRQTLRPFRQYPTLVAVDAKGVARRIVEGRRADFRPPFERAIELATKPAEPKSPTKPKEPAKAPSDGKKAG